MTVGDGRWLRERFEGRRRALRTGLAAAAVLALVVVGFAAQRSGATATGDDPAAPEAPTRSADPASSDDGAVRDAEAGTAPAGSADDAPHRPAGDRETAEPAETVAPAAPVIDWASPRAPSPVTPVAASERVAKPEAVRGIYIGSWSAGSGKALDRLIRLADETEVNAFVIDVKDVTGEISYASRVPLAEQVGATRRVRIGDVRAMLARLKEHGIYPIARIVVFKDPVLATAREDWSIAREDGTIWEDNKGVHWVDAYNRNVWEYNIELAREAIALGFSEVQWDYIRFPDAPRSYMADAVYPARAGRTKAAAIREFMIYSQERLADLDVPVTADVFGVTTSAFGDVGIGQVWEEMADVMDVLLPMVYPSHYPRGTWEYENPNAAPYQIVKKALDHGVSRSREIESAAVIRPWLQAFSLGEPEYGPEHIRAQIDAVYDAGLTEWILWHPGVRYPREAFATAEGREPWFAGRGPDLYIPGHAPEPESLDTLPLDSLPIGEPAGDPAEDPAGDRAAAGRGR